MSGVWSCRGGQGVVGKSSVDTSATWPPVPPERERKRYFHVSWRVTPFNKHSAEGEDPDECLGCNLRLLHDFTGHQRSEMGLIVFLHCL